jgi:hypothetical protein
VSKLGLDTPSQIGHGVWFIMKNHSLALFVKTTMQLRSQRPLHVQVAAGHPGYTKTIFRKIEGQGGEEAQEGSIL